MANPYQLGYRTIWLKKDTIRKLKKLKHKLEADSYDQLVNKLYEYFFNE